MTPYDQEVRKLFEDHSCPVKGSELGARYMTYGLFKIVIDKVLRESYQKGKQDALKEVEHLCNKFSL